MPTSWTRCVIEHSTVKDAVGLAVLCAIAYYADEYGVVGADRENAPIQSTLAARARCSQPTFVRHVELAVLSGELAKVTHGAGRGAWVEYRLLLGNDLAARSFPPEEQLSSLTDNANGTEKQLSSLTVSASPDDQAAPEQPQEQLSSLTDNANGTEKQLSSLTVSASPDDQSALEQPQEQLSSLTDNADGAEKQLSCLTVSASPDDQSALEQPQERLSSLTVSADLPETVKQLDRSGPETVKQLDRSSALPIRARARVVVVDQDLDHVNSDQQQQQPTPRTRVRLPRQSSSSSGRRTPRAAVTDLGATDAGAATGPAWAESAEYAALAAPRAALAALGMEEAAIAATLSIAVTHFGAAALPDIVRDWRAYIDRHADTIRNPAGLIRTRLTGGWPAPKQPVRADLQNLEEVILR